MNAGILIRFDVESTADSVKFLRCLKQRKVQKGTANYNDAVPSCISSPSFASSIVTTGWIGSSV